MAKLVELVESAVRRMLSDVETVYSQPGSSILGRAVWSSMRCRCRDKGNNQKRKGGKSWRCFYLGPAILLGSGSEDPTPTERFYSTYLLGSSHGGYILAQSVGLAK